jgi:Rrf2 family protein
MKLQKNTSLALYSVLEFAADPSRYVATADIAHKYGVSSHHLAKVLSQLARGGILESVRGARGGYRFIGDAGRLTLLDIVELFEPFAPVDEADPAHRIAAGRTLRAVLDGIAATARTALSSVTIAAMLASIEASPRPASRGRAPAPPVTRRSAARVR